MFLRHETATLSREVLATEIPSGAKSILPKGSQVTLMQSLGGSYTVLTEEGRMVRIDGKDGELPQGGRRVEIQMTMTAPGCGMGDVLMQDVRRKVLTVPGVKEADVQVVWDPPWDASRMSDAARLQLGWM